MKDSIEVSILIVSYNNFNILKRCLDSIYNYTKRVSFEVIIVDNNSIENGLSDIVNSYTNLTLIQNKENRGFAAANNQGIEIAKGRYILFLNNDTEFIEDILFKLVQFVDLSEKDYLIGIKLLNTDFSHQNSIVDFPNLWNTFTESIFLNSIIVKSKYFNKYWKNYMYYNQPVKVDIVLGAFIFAKTDIIKDLGGFDSRFYFYAEETDLCKRFQNSGGTVLFYPSLSIIHIGGATTKKNTWFHFMNQHRGKIQYAQKHFTSFRLFLFLLLYYFGLLVRIPIYFIIGMLKFDKNYFLKSYFYIRQLTFYPKNLFINK